MENTEFRHNRDKKQFELKVGDCLCLITYSEEEKGYLDLCHTEVPPPLEGCGLGSLLVQKSLEEIDKEGLRVSPSCSFVRRYIERHPEWEKLL